MTERPDHAILGVAGRQHGLVTREQLHQLGVTRHDVAHRVAHGRLHPIHHGVYAVGRPGLAGDGRLLAAVLAYGPTSVLSHRSAAHRWGLVDERPGPIDVTVPGSSHRRQRGIRVHRARRLAPHDVTRVAAIPATTVSRTLIDLASTMGHRALARAFERADALGLLDLDQVGAALERVQGRRSLARALRVLAGYRPLAPVRSELERLFLALVHDAGLPAPQVNSRVAGLEVDICWPEWRLVVELDGRAYHSSPRSFEADRIRDARLQRAGFRVLRVTYRRLIDAPARVLDDIRALAALA